MHIPSALPSHRPLRLAAHSLLVAVLATTPAAGQAGAPPPVPPPSTPPVTTSGPPGTQQPATGAARPAPALPPLATTTAPGPAIRRIETASALSKEPLTSIVSVLELRDGRVLLNDRIRRRLLIFDTSLTQVQVVLDSMTEVSNAYGTGTGAIIPARADSVLFVESSSLSMLVLDPSAKLVRVRAVPRAVDATRLTSTTGGYPGFDARGRLVFRIPAVAAPPAVAPPPGVPYFPQAPDSAFVVAIDIDTRKLDTLGSTRIATSTEVVRMLPSGGYSFSFLSNPLPTVDEWAVLSDGTVAFLRGRDYRIDWLNPDGKWSSSPKLPFEWQRLTDEDKQRMIDSMRTADRRSAELSWVSSMIRWVNQYNKNYPADFKVPTGYVLSPGLPADWILPPGVTFPPNYIYACAPGTAPPSPAELNAAMLATMPPGTVPPPGMVLPPPSAPGSTPAPATRPCLPTPTMPMGGMAPPMPVQRDVSVIEAKELPDYKPPFAANSMRADADNRLWIRVNPMKPTPGGPVYDVVSKQGEIVDRIQLPTGYTIVGFGKGKIVYLSMRDATGLHLARVRLR